MRIIAGEHRGRKLLPPKGGVTRPITDRVKTALFDYLGGDLPGATVVDLFAGTGSMGLEALSRGAARCYFAERDRIALDRLARNIEAMGLSESCRIWRGDILQRLSAWLDELDGPADLAFVDPPYALVAQWQWAQAAAKIFNPLAAKLAGDGIVMFRCERNAELPAAFGLLSLRERRDYGGMSLLLLRRSGD